MDNEKKGQYLTVIKAREEVNIYILPLHTWPPCFTAVKHHNLMLRVPFTTECPPRTSKRHRVFPVEIATLPGEEKRTSRHGVLPGGHPSKYG